VSSDAVDLTVARQAELLELTQDAILVREVPTSAIVYWNRGAEQLYGWPRNQALGRITHELLDTQFPETRGLVDAVLIRDGHWEGELVHRRSDGSRVVVASRQSLRRDHEGAPSAILEINTDVTERRRAEDERVRRQAEQRARQLAERALDRLARLQAVTAALSEAVTPRQVADVVVDRGIAALGARAGAISLLNEGANELGVVALVGYSDDLASMLRQVSLDEVLPLATVVASREAEFLPTLDAVAARYPRLAEMLRAHGYGAVATAPLIAHGRVIGGMTLSFDGPRELATVDRELLGALVGQCAQALERARLYELALRTQAELRRSRDERDRVLADLRASLRTRDAFLASASHDLKNPLASIKATAQLMLRRLERGGAATSDAQYQALERIDTTVTRAASELDELLDLARLQLDRPLDLERQPVDLVQLVRAIAAEHQQATEIHELRLETFVDELVGDWDERRLTRALGNLVSNALKYSPEGGAIVLRVALDLKSSTRWAVVSVQDYGLGIPAAERDRIFERFQRASNVEGRIAGTGIGLASVRHIAESHGGEVSVESEEGRGSTFTIWLPLTRRWRTVAAP
jgi:PAS domain S-box-containing protein